VAFTERRKISHIGRVIKKARIALLAIYFGICRPDLILHIATKGQPRIKTLQGFNWKPRSGADTQNNTKHSKATTMSNKEGYISLTKKQIFH